MELDERKQKILYAIIRTYMETGEPVGSRTISKYSDLNLSSATIRNEMSDLEEMGYIIQPHTSAGRIPSDKGYRLYVDHILESKDQEVQEFKDLMLERTDKLEPVSSTHLDVYKRQVPQSGLVLYADGSHLSDVSSGNLLAGYPRKGTCGAEGEAGAPVRLRADFLCPCDL